MNSTIESAVAAEAQLVSTGILPESRTSAPDPSAQIAEQAAQIADLQARLNAQIVKGNNRAVELSDGESVTVKDATLRLSEMSVDAQLEILKSQRFIADLRNSAIAATPPAAQQPLLTKEAAIKLLGPTAWAETSNQDKAAILDLRQGDLDKHRPEDVFGPKSSSRLFKPLSISQLVAHTGRQNYPRTTRTRRLPQSLCMVISLIAISFPSGRTTVFRTFERYRWSRGCRNCR